MSNRKKWILRLGITVLAFLLVLTAVWVIFTLRANAILEGELRKVKESGGTLNLQDLIPSDVQGKDNAAIRLEQSFALLTEPDEAEDEALGALQKDPGSAPEESAATVQAWVDKNGQAHSLLLQAFGRDRCRWDLDYSDPITMPLPQLTKMLCAWQLMGARALLDARAGKTEEAFEGLARVLHGTAVCFEEPILIMHLVRLALLADTLEHLAAVLKLAAPGPDAARRLEDELECIDFRNGYKKAMLGERCFGVFAFGLVEKEGRKTLELMATLEESGGSGSPFGTFVLTPRFLFRLDQAEYLRRMQELIDLSSRPYFEVREKWASSCVNDDMPWYSMLTSMVLPALKSSFVTSETGEARVVLARVALALRVHHQSAGTFPETIEALVPARLKSIPVDPFTGRSPLYRRAGQDSCLVYSAGVDGTDDGAKALDNPSGEGGDIVWSLDLTGVEAE